MNYYGNPNLLKSPKAAILNSRQSKRPTGYDPWIVNSLKAVSYCAENGYTVISSIDINTYEIITFACAYYHVPVVVVLPPPRKPEPMIDEILFQFKLKKNKTGFYRDETSSGKRKSHWLSRDEFIISSADTIIPVSVNPKGNLIKMIDRGANNHIATDFQTDYAPQPRKLKEDYSNLTINEKAFGYGWDYLIHWTRTSNEPWPGETRYDYYKDITADTRSYPRSGLDTLKRILSENTLRASGKHLHKNLKAVAFSELHPEEASKLMRWRPRYVSMSFEPYGIAIEKSCASQLGIKKVLYGNPEMYDILPVDDKPFFHSIGETGDWMPEKEYRRIGDLLLNDIPADKMKVIVKSPAEAQGVYGLTKSEVTALFE
ncbi:MAG: hypothetical protein GF307_10370 [candidate division Zixibacteria bacterium]|nr:hypothetical protein [candidate division Zixibacteria bacterium]